MFREPNIKSLYYFKEIPGPGWSNCVDGYPSVARNSVLCNCVGYAKGRINEMAEYERCKVGDNRNAGRWYSNYKYNGLVPIDHPVPGAVVCWGGVKNGAESAGHVAVVEEVKDSTTILCSEAGYGWFYEITTGKIKEWKKTSYTKWDNSIMKPYWYKEYKYTNGTWYKAPTSQTYTFQGFLVDPYLLRNTTEQLSGNTYSGGAFSEHQSTTIEYETKEKTITVTETSINTADAGLNKHTSLLTYPSLVESPFIIAEIGGYKFGAYNKKTGVSNGQQYAYVDYPNFMQSVNITKVNGTLNQYTINMSYQIAAGDDPNFVDKILSRVGYGTIKLSYGDWMSPSFIYKEEEALITKVTSRVDFTSSRIDYTISCTSTSLPLVSQIKQFSATRDKPSNVIKALFNDSSSGLKSVFKGMSSSDLSKYIASDDKYVDIPAKKLDVLSYINFLVTYMSSQSNLTDSVIQDSSYFLTIHDEVYNNTGAYFTIKKVIAKDNTLNSGDVYEVDIGFPGDEFVMNFNVNEDNSWALLYNYSGETQSTNYVYQINNEGEVVVNYSPELTTSEAFNRTTPKQSSWWTQMTQFPITATLTLKGLLRPAMLMTYVRVNAMFYGQKHSASGLYVITKQEDVVDGRGYRTTLTLLRVAGDNDYFTSKTYEKTISYTVPVVSSSSTTKLSFEQKAELGYFGDGGMALNGYEAGYNPNDINSILYPNKEIVNGSQSDR